MSRCNDSAFDGSNLLIHLGAFLSNFPTVAMYFETISTFPNAMFNRRRVVEEFSDLKHGWGAVILIASLLLFYTNQSSYRDNFTEIWRGQRFSRERDAILPLRVRLLLNALTALYKGTVLSLSLATALKEIFNVEDDNIKHLLIGLSCATLVPLPPLLLNALSEFSLFVRPYIHDVRGIPTWLTALSQYPNLVGQSSGFWYNIYNLVLYNRSLNNALPALKLTDHPVLALKKWYDWVILLGAAGSVIPFTISNHISYPEMIMRIFQPRTTTVSASGPPIANAVNPPPDCCTTSCDWVSHVVNSPRKAKIDFATNIYKTFVTTSSCMVLVHLMSKGNWIATGLSGAACFIGQLFLQDMIYKSKLPQTPVDVVGVSVGRDSPLLGGHGHDPATITSHASGASGGAPNGMAGGPYAPVPRNNEAGTVTSGAGADAAAYGAGGGDHVDVTVDTYNSSLCII